MDQTGPFACTSTHPRNHLPASCADVTNISSGDALDQGGLSIMRICLGGQTRTQAGGEEDTGEQSQDGQHFCISRISRVFRAIRSCTKTWNRRPQCPRGTNPNNTLISNLGSGSCERIHSCCLKPPSLWPLALIAYVTNR